jgi:hypothetical protein
MLRKWGRGSFRISGDVSGRLEVEGSKTPSGLRGAREQGVKI